MLCHVLEQPNLWYFYSKLLHAVSDIIDAVVLLVRRGLLKKV